MIEDNLPDHFKRIAYHPSAFIYAWKRKELEKLFEELNLSNIAIKSVEVWKVEKDKIEVLIPTISGDITLFNHKLKREDAEEWNDFVNRSTKETLDLINDWNLSKTVTKTEVNKIYYHFELMTEKT